MRYSIGDVSRVLGMTTSALHFYEKEGVIDTPKVESGWRYYEEADVNRLICAKKYRSMGVPVRDIAQQFSHDGMSGAQVFERVRARREEAAHMAQVYSDLVRDMDRVIMLSEDALSAVGVVDIRRAEDMLMLRSGSGGRIPQEKAEQALMRRWLEAMPAVYPSICKEKDRNDAEQVLMIPAQRAAECGFTADGKNMFLVSGGMALHAVIVCGDEQYAHPERIFKAVQAFAQEHRFVQKGIMWGNQLFVDCSGGGRRHYYDTYMVFE